MQIAFPLTPGLSQVAEASPDFFSFPLLLHDHAKNRLPINTWLQPGGGQRTTALTLPPFSFPLPLLSQLATRLKDVNYSNGSIVLC